jgi:hypothetical protein
MTFTQQALPEFLRINAARVHEEMDPLPSDEMLNATLQAAGFMLCEWRKYPWA